MKITTHFPKWLFRTLMTGFSVFLLVFVIVPAVFGVRINQTDSERRGFYVPAVHSDLVEICPEGKVSEVSRHYRKWALFSACPDGLEPFLKHIVARTGDTVVLDSEGVLVNGLRLPNSRAFETDSKNRPLPRLWPARYVLAPDEVFVINSYSERSFDSRYFGPVSLASVRAHMAPLWTWR